MPVVREIDEDGKKVSRGFLTVTVDDKTEDKPYKDYLDANWKPFEASLRPAEQETHGSSRSRSQKFASLRSMTTRLAKQAAAGQARSTHSAF